MKPIFTDRCYICKLKEGDIHDVKKIFINEQTRKFLGGTISENKAIEKLNKMLSQNVFCIRLKENNCFIGIIYILPYYDENFYELSYEFLPDFWHKGLAYETLKEVLNYCKNELHLSKLVSETQKANTSSRKLLEKLGYSIKEELIRFGNKQVVYHICL